MLIKRRYFVLLSLLGLLAQAGCVAMGGAGQRSVTHSARPTATVAVAPAAATLAPTVTLSPPAQRTPELATTVPASDGDAAVTSLPGIVFQNSAGTWLVEDGGTWKDVAPGEGDGPNPGEGDGPIWGEETLTAPPPGLLVALGSREEGWDLALAGADGQLQMVVEQIAPPAFLPDFDVAPDGQRILYASGGDIWLLDMVTGTAENVTRTPARVEQSPRWWPDAGEATRFVCGSRPIEAGEGPSHGYLTLVGADGGYEVPVEEGELLAPPAPGPDGQTVAYSRIHERQSASFLYRLDSGEEAFDFAAYGLDWVERSGEASWSPDGLQLAWSVAGNRDGDYYASEVLLNLAENDHTLLHAYRPQPVGGYLPAPRWAPDGSWLSFMALDLERQWGGLWWVHLEDGVARQLSPTFIRPALVRHPAVSPDGKWIAVPTIYGTGVGLIDVEGQRAAVWTEAGEVAAVAWAK